MLPVSPYLTKRLRELSEALAGMDAEGDESSEWVLKLGRLIQGRKYKIGWYKVPHISYDYMPQPPLTRSWRTEGSKNQRSGKCPRPCLCASSGMLEL